MGSDAQGEVRYKYSSFCRFHLIYWKTDSFGRRTISLSAGLPKICRMAELKMILFGLALVTIFVTIQRNFQKIKLDKVLRIKLLSQ